MVACMAVMARETWTDERLDDLNARVDRGFDEVKGEIKDLRSGMNERFAHVDSRLDSNQRTMVLGFASIVASILATQL
ncbi:MAG TPA: hypothetical protein VGK41_05980 [Solirubrobacterales bacterium]